MRVEERITFALFYWGTFSGKGFLLISRIRIAAVFGSGWTLSTCSGSYSPPVWRLFPARESETRFPEGRFRAPCRPSPSRSGCNALCPGEKSDPVRKHSRNSDPMFPQVPVWDRVFRARIRTSRRRKWNIASHSGGRLSGSPIHPPVVRPRESCKLRLLCGKRGRKFPENKSQLNSS